MSPKIIAFETEVYCTRIQRFGNYSDHVADRLSEENIKLAKFYCYGSGDT